MREDELELQVKYTENSWDNFHKDYFRKLILKLIGYCVDFFDGLAPVKHEVL